MHEMQARLDAVFPMTILGGAENRRVSDLTHGYLGVGAISQKKSFLVSYPKCVLVFLPDLAS